MAIYKVRSTGITRILNCMFKECDSIRELPFIVDGKYTGIAYRILRGRLRIKYNGFNLSEKEFMELLVKCEAKTVETGK